MTKTFGVKCVWGVPSETKPIAGLPVGKVRLKFRPGDVGKAYVKDEHGTRGFFIVIDESGGWYTGEAYSIGRNERMK